MHTAAQRKAWRKANPEKVKSYQKKWNDRNPDKIKKISANSYKRNAERVNARSIAWAKANPRLVLASTLKRKYGITLAFYDVMVIEQNGRCAICSIPMVGWNEPSVDHNHTTNDVRELLCRNCNLAIGFLKENPELFIKARNYLLRHSG